MPITIVSGDPLTEKGKQLIAKLVEIGDDAYCDYIDLLERNECLEWEAKVAQCTFGAAELKAHTDAAELLGRHRALHAAARLLRELLNDSESHATGDGKKGTENDRAERIADKTEAHTPFC